MLSLAGNKKAEILTDGQYDFYADSEFPDTYSEHQRSDTEPKPIPEMLDESYPRSLLLYRTLETAICEAMA